MHKTYFTSQQTHSEPVPRLMKSIHKNAASFQSTLSDMMQLYTSSALYFGMPDVFAEVIQHRLPKHNPSLLHASWPSIDPKTPSESLQEVCSNDTECQGISTKPIRSTLTCMQSSPQLAALCRLQQAAQTHIAFESPLPNCAGLAPAACQLTSFLHTHYADLPWLYNCSVSQPRQRGTHIC